MGQEFFINSQELETKIRQLLPSQGGSGAGFDLSASTQIIPVIDLTESAEGSNVREDLQRSYGLTSASDFSVSNTTTAIISNTGYFNILANFYGVESTSVDLVTNQISITDGTTTKILWNRALLATGVIRNHFSSINLNVFVQAGETVNCTVTNGGTLQTRIEGITRQIADIDGNLTNP